jgi:hypothetical protein
MDLSLAQLSAGSESVGAADRSLSSKHGSQLFVRRGASYEVFDRGSNIS